MKLRLLSLLALLGCRKVLASEFDLTQEQEIDEDDAVLISPEEVKIEIWEYIPSERGVEEPISGTEASPFNWSLASILGNFFYSAPSPAVKKVESLPALAEADLNIEQLAGQLNCKPDQLMHMDLNTLKRLATFTSLPHVEILGKLADIGDLALFELFFLENARSIMSGVTTNREFHAVVFNCIKMNSLTSFFNVMLEPKFPLNGPQAVLFASMYGSHEILRFVLEQVDSPDYDWSWRSIDGSSGYMLAFGTEPHSAAVFLGAIKAIKHGHIKCLEVLIEAKVDPTSKDYLLLKETAKQPIFEIFSLIYGSISSIPVQDMTDVLAIAIQANNEILVSHLLTLEYNYNIVVNVHLMAAISTKNPVLFGTILSLITTPHIDGNVLNQAAASGNEEIFVALIKLSKREFILIALCNCILNEQYHHFVPLICDAVTLNAEMITQGLVHSIRVGSVEFVNIFLKKAISSEVPVKSAFIAAMESDNRNIIQSFYVKYENDSDLLNTTGKSLNALMEKLFERKAWNSLHEFVIRFFLSEQFPRQLLLAMIMDTDQIEIARTIASYGVTFPHYAASDIKDEKMREFVLSHSSKNKSRK